MWDLNWGVANSFWDHVIQISSRQMYFQGIYSNLWKVKVFSGNIYSLKSNTYFWGTVMLVQDGFLYLIVTRHKLTVQQGLLDRYLKTTWTVFPPPRIVDSCISQVFFYNLVPRCTGPIFVYWTRCVFVSTSIKIVKKKLFQGNTVQHYTSKIRIF